MNTTLLFLSFLLFAFSPILTLVSAQDPDPVLDISGNQLQTGTGYYILPVFRGRGGGLTLASTRNATCPLDVVQAQSEVESGLPAIFTAFNDDNVVRVSVDNNIRFSAQTICVQSTVWRLATRDEDGETVVSTGGVAGNPGRETLSNWFEIEKDGEDYKIVFCPGVCDICRPRCGEIGIVEENGRWRLAIYNESQLPLKVMFRKA